MNVGKKYKTSELNEVSQTNGLQQIPGGQNRKDTKVSQIRSQKPLFTRNWSFEQKFSNKKLALAFMENDWIVKEVEVSKDRIEGRKVNYRCNRIKDCSPKCSALKCLFYPDKSDEVFMYTNDKEHQIEPQMWNQRVSKKWLSSEWDQSDSEVTLTPYSEYFLELIHNDDTGEKELLQMEMDNVPIEWCLDDDISTKKDVRTETMAQPVIIETVLQEEPIIKDDLVEKELQIAKAVSLQNMTNLESERKIKAYKRKYEEIGGNVSIGKNEPQKPKFLSGWNFEVKFPNKKVALEFLSDNNWTIIQNEIYKLSDGHKVHYRCNWLNLNGTTCNILRCVFYPNDCTEVFMYTSNREHMHHVDQATSKPEPIENWDLLISSEWDSSEQVNNDNEDENDSTNLYLDKLNPKPIDVLTPKRTDLETMENSDSNFDSIVKEGLIIEELDFSEQTNNINEVDKESTELYLDNSTPMPINVLPPKRTEPETMENSDSNIDSIVKEELIIEELDSSGQTNNNNEIDNEWTELYLDDLGESCDSNTDSILKEELIVELDTPEQSNGTEIDNDSTELFLEDLNPMPIDVLRPKNKDLEIMKISHSNDSILKEKLIIDYHTSVMDKNDSIFEAPSINGFIFKEKFSNLSYAMHKISQISNNWSLTCKRQHGILRYYTCYHSYNGGICGSRAVLFVRPEFNDVLYYESGKHLHSINSDEDNTNLTLNESQITVKEEKEKKVCQWQFKRELRDYRSAVALMHRFDLITLRKETASNGYKEYFACDLGVGIATNCLASCYLQYVDPTNVVFLYMRNVQHTVICRNKSHLWMHMKNRSRPPTTEKRFETFSEARLYLEQQRIWIYWKTCSSKYHYLKVYRCNQLDSTGAQCAATKCIRVDKLTRVSYLNIMINPNHIHESPDESDQEFEILDEDTKTKIKELAEVGYTPERILEELELSDFDIRRQQNFRDWIRKFQNPLNDMHRQSSYKTIRKWFLRIRKIPNKQNEHEPYCVNYCDKGNSLYFLSTRYLLKNALISKSIHIDSSLVLDWYGHPITIVGTTDPDQRFRVFGLAISMETKQDYEFMFLAIRKGVEECYQQDFKPEYVITNSRRVYEPFNTLFGPKVATSPKLAVQPLLLSVKMSRVSSSVKTELDNDFLKILKLSSRKLFIKAKGLLFQKWESRGVYLGKILERFTFWAYRISNWFEVFPNYRPDTNQAIQSEYDMLRKNLDEPTKPTIHAFYPLILRDNLEKLSRSSCKTEFSFYKVNKTPTAAVHKEAIEWKNLKKDYKCVESISDIQYYFPAGDDKLICEVKFKEYQDMCQETLDEFLRVYYSFWCVTRSKKTGSFTCSCPQFWEHAVCVHSVGLKLILEQANVK